MERNPYAKYLGADDPVELLETTNGRLEQQLRALTPEQIETSPSAGKWSVREIVAHLADCEIAFGFRLRQTLSQNNPELQPFDQETWAERYRAYSLPEALALFGAARAWNLKLIVTASDSDRRRPATHPERGPIDFWTIVETMAGHDVNHLGQIVAVGAIGSKLNIPEPSAR